MLGLDSENMKTERNEFSFLRAWPVERIFLGGVLRREILEKFVDRAD